MKFRAQSAVLAPSDLVVPVRRLENWHRVLPRSGQRRALAIADDPPLVAVVEPGQRIGAEYAAARVVDDVEGALVAATRDRFEIVAVVPADAICRAEQKDIAVAPAEADGLVAPARIGLVPIDEDRGPV